MNRSLYLAGPIHGLNYEGATDWREQARQVFASHNIDAFSPMRGKDYLKDVTSFDGAYEDFPLSTGPGIMMRDHYDCTNRDGIFVNFIGSPDDKVSIGTVMEIAWGHHVRSPIVIVTDPNNVHVQHPMIQQASPFIVNTLEEGYHIMTSLLLP